MREKQNGFGVVEGLLILIIVGLIGFTAWFVWHSKNSTDTTFAAADKAASSQIASKETAAIKDTPAKSGSKIPAAENSTAAQAAATKITVTSVKDMPGSSFAKTGYTPPSGNLRVVYLSIHNSSATDQQYDVSQFSAATSSGEIVKPRVYSPVESTLWNNATLASDGSKDITIAFGTDQAITTLYWKSATGNITVAVTLPKVTSS